MESMTPPARLPRLIATVLLLVGLLALPAAAQEEQGSGDDLSPPFPTAEEEEEDRASRPSRGAAQLATGEVTGRLAPAVAQPGQQIVVHAVTQLFDQPGQGGGRPDPAGPRRTAPVTCLTKTKPTQTTTGHWT